jgi:hypothetical protein
LKGKKMKNKQFITEIHKKEDVAYEGPKISASSWEAAKKKATKQGAILVGTL